jgi:PKD repeat protein
MANQLSNLDELIKSTYESHEFQYDPSLWEEVEKEISISTPPFGSLISSAAVGLTIVAIVFGSFGLIDSFNSSETVTYKSNIENSYLIGEHSESKIDNQGVIAQQSSDFSGITTEKTSEPANEKLSTTEAKSNSAAIRKPTFTAEQKETVKSLIAEVKELTEEHSKNSKDESVEEGLSIIKGCTGMTIDFESPSDYGDNAKYLWNFGDGFFSNEENPTHTFKKEGVFDVSLSVTAVGSGQISSNVVEAMIEVHEAPIADFNVKISGINDLELYSTSQNALSYEWLANDRVLPSNESRVTFTVESNVKYEFELKAQNAGRCEDVAEKVIHVIEAGNQFPHAYSTSYATDFAPGAIVDNGEVLEFKVFSAKTGNEIFSSAGRKGWNGKDSTGTKVDAGIYKWMMIVKGKDAHNVFSGELQLK